LGLQIYKTFFDFKDFLEKNSFNAKISIRTADSQFDFFDETIIEILNHYLFLL
jgi:hypothetical protein